jgi:hypothetical protein
VKTNKNQHVWERFVTIVIPGGDKSVLSAVAAYSENSGVLKTTEFWSKPLHTATTQSKHSSAVHLISL